MTERAVEKQAYSPKEFAATYSVSLRGLYRLWEEGRGPRRCSVGRRVLIRRADADAWLEDQVEKAA